MAAAKQSSNTTMAPFRVAPRFVNRVWGYHDLRPWYDRTAEKEPIGEVWLTGDDCLIETGPHTGKRLGSLFTEAHELLMGTCAPSTASPLLIKVIFAREKLSVQVHPDDELACKHGQPRGKTECWYALAAEPGARLACGFKPGLSLEKIEEGIRTGTLEEILNVLDIAAGEMIFVDAGTIHAIWPGSILLEAQQNCDLTYRMYDYGRPRELHTEKSLEAVRFETQAGKIAARKLPDRTILIDTKYFCVEKVETHGSRSSRSLAGMDEAVPGLAYLFAAGGRGKVSGGSFEPVELPAFGIVAIPAASPEFAVEDLGGLELIRITPNWPQNELK